VRGVCRPLPPPLPPPPPPPPALAVKAIKIALDASRALRILAMCLLIQILFALAAQLATSVALQ